MYNLNRLSILKTFRVKEILKWFLLLNAKERKINGILLFDFYIVVLSLTEK